MTAGLTKAQGSIAKFGTASNLAFAGAAVGIAAFGIAAVKAGMESQQVMAQTEAVLKSTGGSANVTATQISDLAEHLRDLSGVDDDVIQASSNLLLTFRAVRNEVGAGNDIFNQAQTAIVDMATALNEGAVPSMEDLHSATLQLGKALNDPLTGLTALRRAGVSFTAEQTELIKTLTESGHLMEAQKMILAELSKEFGGAAKAAGQTLAGQMAILGSQLRDVFEQVGLALIPVLTTLVKILKATLVPALKAAADNAGILLAAFAAWTALKFIPPLLLSIASALEAVGAAGLAGKILSVAVSVESLGAMLLAATPFAIGFAAAFVGLTTAVAAWDPLNLVGDTEKLRDSMEVNTKAFGESHIMLGRVAVSSNLVGENFKTVEQAVASATTDIEAVRQASFDAANGLDAAGRAAETTGHTFGRVGRDIRNGIVEEFAGIPGTIENVKQAFDIKPQELVRLTETWRKIGKRIANDLKVIGESDLKPAVRDAILQLPPEMRDAWVHGTDAQRSKIEAATQRFLNIQDQIPKLAHQAEQGTTGIGRAMVDGLVSGADAQAGILYAKMTSIVREAITAARRAAAAGSPSKKMMELGHDLMEGLKDGIGDKDREVAQKLTDSIGKMLDAAKSALGDFKSKMRDFAGGISGGFSSFSDLVGGFGKGEEPLGIQDFLASQLAGAQGFADVLDALKRQGASKGLLSQIAGAGPEGLGFAQALLQGGPELVEQASQQLAAINKIADHEGGVLSKDFFGAKMDKLQERADRIKELLAEANRLQSGKGGDIILKLDGKEIARVTRNELLHLGARNGSTGL